MSVADSEELFHIPGGVGIASVDSFNGYTWNQTQVSNLPDTIYGYCLVKINSSSLLLIGGSHKSDPYGVRSSTYFHDSISNTWRSGPNLQLPRMFHACAVLNWKNESSQKLERTVLVAGGYYGAALTSVELLHLTSLDANLTWVSGSDLPKGSQSLPWLNIKIQSSWLAEKEVLTDKKCTNFPVQTDLGLRCSRP